MQRFPILSLRAAHLQSDRLYLYLYRLWHLDCALLSFELFVYTVTNNAKVTNNQNKCGTSHAAVGSVQVHPARVNVQVGWELRIHVRCVLRYSSVFSRSFIGLISPMLQPADVARFVISRRIDAIQLPDRSTICTHTCWPGTDQAQNIIAKRWEVMPWAEQLDAAPAVKWIIEILRVFTPHFDVGQDLSQVNVGIATVLYARHDTPIASPLSHVPAEVLPRAGIFRKIM